LNWETGTAIVTAIVALYGAGLSTYILIANRKEKQRQLSVSFSTGSLTYGTELSPQMLFINITNPGNRAVTIYSPSIKLPDSRQMFFRDPQQADVGFPHELKEGKNCRVWIEMKELAMQLAAEGYPGKVHLSAKVEDATGKSYKSKGSWKLDLNKWVK